MNAVTNAQIRLYVIPALLMTLLAGCATQGKPPPVISLDEPVAVAAQPLPEPPTPIEAVAIPQPLPLPAQLKPLPLEPEAVVLPEPADEKVRVSRANEEARMAPTREGYVNAIQVWPYTDGALYQVYASPGRVTVIALQPGEELVTVAAGDTVRWIVGDTASGSGGGLRGRVYIQVPAGIAQGELPPLFVIGAQGDGQLVNYRYRAPYFIVDRLFGAAELRLGGEKAEVVRIERTDGLVGAVRGN